MPLATLNSHFPRSLCILHMWRTAKQGGAEYASPTVFMPLVSRKVGTPCLRTFGQGSVSDQVNDLWEFTPFWTWLKYVTSWIVVLTRHGSVETQVVTQITAIPRLCFYRNLGYISTTDTEQLVQKNVGAQKPQEMVSSAHPHCDGRILSKQLADLRNRSPAPPIS